MAVTGYWYGKAIINAFGGETAGESTSIDYLSDTIKVALCTSSYTPSQDTHEFFSDITNEVSESGTNYTAGGATLSGKTLSYTAGTNVAKFDADDVTWASSTITARYGIIYKSTGTANTSPLLGYVDFGQNYSSSNGNFTITWDSAGILTATAA